MKEMNQNPKSHFLKFPLRKRDKPEKRSSNQQNRFIFTQFFGDVYARRKSVMFVKALILLPLFMSLPVLQACSGGNQSVTSSSPAGKYEFVMYDSSDSRLLDGMITLRKTDTTYVSDITISNKYADFYSYGNMKSAKNYTHYNKNEKTLFINMNPSSTDDNIFITLTSSGNELNGNWTHTTIAGDMGKGKFTAKKLKSNN